MNHNVNWDTLEENFENNVDSSAPVQERKNEFSVVHSASAIQDTSQLLLSHSLVWCYLTSDASSLIYPL